jgi:hypothetical protein
VQRRLSAILAADVVGYSRLMGDDETGTLEALRRHRRELLAPKIAEHAGRIVKLMGDGALVEFASAVEAVACAVNIQVLMRDRNQEIPEDRRIIFRIGINIGDVILEGRGHLRRRRQHRRPAREPCRPGRHLHFAQRAQPSAGQAPSDPGGSRRDGGQEYRAVGARLCRRPRR